LLLVRSHRILRANNFDRSKTSDLNLLLIIRKRFLGECQCFLLNFHVLVCVDQIPIEVLNLVDGGNDLKTERDVCDLAIVFGDLNQTRIREESESLQKM